MSCEHCNLPTAGRCTICQIAYYCGPNCQQADRVHHAGLCDRIAPAMRRFLLQEQEHNRCGYTPETAARLRDQLSAFHTSHPELDNAVRMSMELTIRSNILNQARDARPVYVSPTPLSAEYMNAMRELNGMANRPRDHGTE